MLANALLVQDLVGQPSIDLVNWTLVIELHFYLLVGVLAAALVALGSVLGMIVYIELAKSAAHAFATAAGSVGSTPPALAPAAPPAPPAPPAAPPYCCWA